MLSIPASCISCLDFLAHASPLYLMWPVTICHPPYFYTVASVCVDPYWWWLPWKLKRLNQVSYWLALPRDFQSSSNDHYKIVEVYYTYSYIYTHPNTELRKECLAVPHLNECTFCAVSSWTANKLGRAWNSSRPLNPPHRVLFSRAYLGLIWNLRCYIYNKERHQIYIVYIYIYATCTV